ncbi:MAG: hypothetical protein MPL62_10110 [Alphaproteobacteria bacterium]|nr:hypothetical protein [Alphaproteobacteria bacterium]
MLERSIIAASDKPKFPLRNSKTTRTAGSFKSNSLARAPRRARTKVRAMCAPQAAHALMFL